MIFSPEKLTVMRLMPPREVMKLWDDIETLADRNGEYLQAVRALCLNDLYYLLVKVCGRKDMLPCKNKAGFVDNQFAFDRCREVEINPDGYLDLWGREHGKSSIITFGLTIQDILNDPEITIGIFSHTRPIAKAFLRQIMREFEENRILQAAFPDILCADVRMYQKFSEDDGIIVKRKSNPKESTVEAWGLVDGQPTALDINTPVMTTKGWKHHGDLAVGDFVYGADGKPVMIIWNSGVMYDKPCLKVVMDDNDIVAAEDHLWAIDRVISPRDKITNKQNTGWNVTKREIVKTSDLPLSSGKNRDKRRRLLSTPTITHDWNMNLVIDPYVLGFWLGDGTSNQDIITTQDYEILDYFKDYEIKVAQDRGTYKMFRLIGLRPQLKSLFLLKNKHIPMEYLYAKPEYRLALFQGLMDSDGSCRKKVTSNDGAQCVFTNTNRMLIEQTHYIAASLGLKPSRITEYHDGDKNHKPRLTFSFTGTLLTPPFRLNRKLQYCVQDRKNKGRYVRKLEKIDSVPVNCIQVAKSDGIYLAGKSLVPTHNSKHYRVLLYDDIVVKDSVSNPEMIQKTMTALEQSYNLGVTPGGVRRFAGTRWHFGDAYRTIKDRGTAIPREYPGRSGGTEDGESIYWDEETHLLKRRDYGPYTYACFTGKTKILMGDWSEKPIDQITSGDFVIGYTFPVGETKDHLPKSRLIKTRVLATEKYFGPVVRFTFESGRTIECTPEHKFFSGRRGKDIGGIDTHKTYSSLGFGYKELHAAIPIYDPRLLHCQDELTAAWLSGLWDGEGSVSAGAICISQSPEHNPLVCARIESSLKILGFDYGTHERPACKENGRNNKAGRIYYLRGGRQEKMRFLNICKPARAYKIIKALEDTGTRKFGKIMQEKLISIEQIGNREIFNIETETGNYIAEGYAVKNSQILMNPKADAMQGFKREWLRKFKSIKNEKMNWYLLVDAASSKKKGSDYTAIWAVGLGADQNYYCIPVVRDRLNLKERSDALFAAHREYKPKQVRYEKYGLMSDIEHMQSRMEQENYRFKIEEVGGQTSKSDRIKRLLPLFEAGRIWIPESRYVTDWQKVPVDLIHAFIEEEYMAFPVGLHDDQLDGLARICEPDLKLVWPMEAKKEADTMILHDIPSNVAWMM